jgi:PPM family protein phosphatase
MPKKPGMDRSEHYLPFQGFDTENAEEILSSSVRIDFGAISHVGNVRKNNQDAFLIYRTGRFWESVMTNLDASLLPNHQEENGYAMAVADGMGGLSGGDVASRMALTVVVNLMLSSVKWALKLNHPKLREKEIQEAINRAIEYLSKADIAISRHARLEGIKMGTTLTAAYSFADDLFILHVGDSRAYLFREGKIVQLTHDHTVAQSFADAGAIPQSAVKGHHFRHMLTRAIGLHEGDVIIEIHQLKLKNDDVILLCSDGLSDTVNADEMTDALKSDQSSQEQCKTLLDLALSHGGKDNITAVIGHYRF